MIVIVKNTNHNHSLIHYRIFCKLDENDKIVFTRAPQLLGDTLIVFNQLNENDKFFQKGTYEWEDNQIKYTRKDKKNGD